MSVKAKTLWANIVAGALGLCALVAGMPGTLQDQVAQPFPEKYRGYIAIAFAVAAYISRTYAGHAAASSTPDPNAPK